MYKPLDYWYDAQQRRFLEQVVLAFSGFQYQTGWSEKDGKRVAPRLMQVNASMALTDRQVGHIMRNNSENTLLTVPRITVHQTELQLRRGDLQNPNHVDTRQVIERTFDETTGKYGTDGKRGRSSTVMRMMALPFEMTIQVDVWTANLDQKYQLAEQILVACAPDFAIQNSDNPLDWTAMTMCELTNINYSSRSVPVGQDDEIDIMTLTFRLPIWLSPPAKVMQQNVIEEIIANVHDGRGEDAIIADNPLFTSITTPGNHSILVQNGQIVLLGPEDSVTDSAGEVYSFEKLIELYDAPLRPAYSKIRLKTSPDQIDDWSHDLIGTIQYDPQNKNKLFWTLDPDTLPANTLPPIDGIANPVRRWPGQGLPDPVPKQRYLLTHDIGGPTQAWGNLRAHENDIVEYVAGQWQVIFSPVRGDHTPHYVLNLGSGEQLRWNGEDWVKTIDGIYPAGYWRFNL